MRRRYLVGLCRALVLTLIVALPATATAQGGGWTAPKTAWGDPDLQGTYTNKTTTPLQRPDDLADREFLTEEEVAERERAALDRNEQLLLAPARKTTAGGNVGAYNKFWLDGGTRPTGRTSLLSNPANGRLPALTLEAERRAEARDPLRWARTSDG